MDKQIFTVAMVRALTKYPLTYKETVSVIDEVYAALFSVPADEVVENERGVWQRVFVKKLTDMGIDGEQSMKIMGLVCEEREHTYVQGNSKGYNDGYADCKKRLAAKDAP